MKKRRNKIVAIFSVLFVVLAITVVLMSPRLYAEGRIRKICGVLAAGEFDYIIVLDPLSRIGPLPGEREAVLDGESAEYAAELLLGALKSVKYKANKSTLAGNWDRRVRIVSGSEFYDIYLAEDTLYFARGKKRYVFLISEGTDLKEYFDKILAEEGQTIRRMISSGGLFVFNPLPALAAIQLFVYIV